MIIQGNNSELILPRGDAFRLALELFYQGAEVPLADEAGFFAVFDAQGNVLGGRQTMSVRDDGLWATDYIGAEFSQGLPNNGLSWEIRLNTADGADRVATGTFRVTQASGAPPAGDPPVGSTVVTAARSPTARLKFVMQGRPGLSAAALAGMTPSEYDASVRAPALAAAGDANTAAGNANTAAQRAEDAAADIGDVSQAVSQAQGAAAQAVALAPQTFETLDNTSRLLLTDQAGRVVAELPDPRILSILTQLLTVPNAYAYERIDQPVLVILDAAGREAFAVPDLGPAVAVAAALAQAASNTAGQNSQAIQTLNGQVAVVPGTGVYETNDLGGGPTLLVLDQAGRQLLALPDARVDTLATSAASGATFETTDGMIAAYVLDAGGRVFAAVPSQAAVAAATPTTVQEVVDARGNMGTLAARLAAVVSADGAPLVERYGKGFLRQMHYRLAKRSLPTPESVQLIINAAGDSYTHNASRWTGPYMDTLAAKYGDAGGGWCGFGGSPSGTAPFTPSNQPSFTNGNVRPSTYPTRVLGSPVQTYYTQASPDLASLTLAAAGDAVVQAFPASPVHNGCDLFFYGTADGVVQYSWGTYNSGNSFDPASYTFGAATQLQVQGTLNTTQVADIKAGMPAGRGMLKIEWVSGTAKLFGVNLKSAADGVRVNKLAATGSNISQWANAPATQWEAGLALLGAHAVVYMDGTNSQTSGMAPVTWGNYLTTLVGRFRAANPAIDVLLATPPENQRGLSPAMPLYALECRKRALALRAAFKDMQPAFGDPSNPAEYSSTGPIPLFNADGIHPEPALGGRSMLAEFMDMTNPY